MLREHRLLQGWRSSLKGALLLSLVVLAAALVGALLGLQPYLAIPFVIPIVVAFVLWLGARSSRRAIGLGSGWAGYAVLTFWVLTINVPAFMAFDQSGFTRDHGLFNPQSIARIALFTIALFLAACFWILWEQSTLRSKSYPVAGGWLLGTLYLWYLVQAPLATSGLPLAMAVFRVAEWVVAFGLLGLAFSVQNARGQLTFDDRLRLIMPVLFFLLASVLLLLVVAPGAAYQESRITGTARLGGLFTHPNLLAVVATILFAYCVGYWRGWKRFAMATLCVAVVGLTYSRGGYIAFLLVLMIGMLILVRHAGARVIALLVAALTALMLAQAPGVTDEVNRFLLRGNETQSLSDLSERTAVWEAAKTLIRRSPWLGEGFFSGPKLLGEEMIRSRLSHNFAAVHAHNELLQAQLAGGIVASILTLAIHGRVFFLALFRVRLRPAAAYVLWSVVISVTVLGLLQPTLSYLLTLPGVLFGWALLTLEGLAKADPSATEASRA